MLLKPLKFPRRDSRYFMQTMFILEIDELIGRKKDGI